MGRIYAIRSKNTMFPAGEKLGKRWRAGRKWKSLLSSEGVFSAEFGAGNGADFGNFYVRLLGKAWYPVFLSDTSSEGVENVFSMAWTSANILTGESYSTCRDGRKVRLGKLGKFRAWRDSSRTSAYVSGDYAGMEDCLFGE